ncbi:MAG: radical SAM-associated putative lipoprotein [Paludibacteraceae bacterium]|nr:radical SAM-associated putative lipoprotein [Paludibacteraceae bacterium]
MKTKVLKGINALLAAILGLLGVSCHIGYAEYGSPYATFEISGTVSNEDDEPLQNIQIVHQRGWKDGAGTTYWSEWPDTLYTDADGKFYRNYGGDFPLEYRKLVVNDTTGVYASDSVDTTVTYSGGDHHWYHGKGELKADFVLKKKQ